MPMQNGLLSRASIFLRTLRCLALPWVSPFSKDSPRGDMCEMVAWIEGAGSGDGGGEEGA